MKQKLLTILLAAVLGTTLSVSFAKDEKAKAAEPTAKTPNAATAAQPGGKGDGATPAIPSNEKAQANVEEHRSGGNDADHDKHDGKDKEKDKKDKKDKARDMAKKKGKDKE